ncbi:9172_t:CDS:10, partial [Diversispora eburnea]
MYHYVVNVHKSSTVSSAVKGHWSSPTETNLLINKVNRIDVYTLVEGGLRYFMEIPINGRIAGMHFYRGPVLFTERLDYVVMSWCAKRKRILTEEQGTLKHDTYKFYPNRELLHLTIIDPYYRVVGMHVYSGILADGIKNISVKAYPLYTKEIGNEIWSLDDLDESTQIIRAVPSGGFLLVSARRISLYDEDHGSRWLIGNGFGTLQLLVLPKDEPMYTYISVPTSILYLDNGIVFIGSHFGDSQIIKLRSEPNEQGFYLDEVERFSNLAPIHDFCVLKTERPGQSQVITCSGGLRDGTLRIIRNGVGITVHGETRMTGLTGIWALRPSYDSEYDDILIISFINETRIMKLIDDEFHEVDNYADIDKSHETLATCNVAGNLIVTRNSIRLIDMKTKKLCSKWNITKNNTITVADVSCLTIHPSDPSNPEKSIFAVVGLWSDKLINVLNLPSLTIIQMQKLFNTSVPRSVMLETFEGILYLLIGFGDGQVDFFILNQVNANISGPHRTFTIGNQQVILCSFKANGIKYVFAASDKPAIIYSKNYQLLCSNVNTKNVTYVRSFKTPAMPSSLIIIHNTGFKISSIDDIHKLHITSIPLNEMPRRICHQESSNMLAISTIKSVFDELKNCEIHLCYFKILDDQTFE